MSMERERHVIDLLPEYVLGMLADDERRLVAEHVSTCQACRMELAQLQRVTDDLPLAITQSEPPSRVKDNLMQAIHKRQSRRAPARQESLWHSLRQFLRRSAPAWGLALIIVLALGNWIQWSGSQTANPMRVIALASTSDAPQAVGTLVMDPQGHYGTLVVDNLAALDAAHQYQVWLIQDGSRRSAGLFSVNPEGYASLELWAPNPLIQYDAIGITVEPNGGSPGPTGAKVLGGNITH